jgi:hypothetical protein
MEQLPWMRRSILIALVSVSGWAQNQPVCSGVALDVDARCACVKDPNSQACGLVKSGLYEPRDFTKWKPYNPGLAATVKQPAARAAARPRQARVVPLAHKDYLRFLPPNAQLAAGFDFEKVFQSSPELLAALFGQGENDGGRGQLMGALKEMDHLWFSFSAPNDIVILMTGRFEQGAAAGMFYAEGIQPVFLGGAHAMMVGSEPSIQAALGRLGRPAAAKSSEGWVTRRARELSKEHETWIATEPPRGTNQSATALSGVRQFAFGVRLSGTAGIDGEVVADSEAGAEKIAAWVDQTKAAIREKTGVGVLDSVTVDRVGTTLRFSGKDDGLLDGPAGKNAMNSDLGVELYNVIMAGFPGMPPRSVAEDKLLAVKAGMRREEVLSLVGPPLSVSSIQGLDLPRETWTYQIAFGKRLSVRLDGGVVTAPPH